MADPRRPVELEEGWKDMQVRFWDDQECVPVAGEQLCSPPVCSVLLPTAGG
jgi:hypothetical protein